MDTKTIGAFAVVVIIIAGGWYYVASQPSDEVAETQTGAPADTSAQPAATGTAINPQSQNVTVTYTDAGFSPQKVSIPVGATVTFINQSSHGMWVATGPHPAHTGYDESSRSAHCVAGYSGALPFDECKNDTAGASWSFTFDKAGTWPYHNHSAAQDYGSVEVTAPVQNGGVTPLPQ